MKLLVRVLEALSERLPSLRLVELQGGDKHNAIPREAFATVLLPKGEGMFYEEVHAGTTRDFQPTVVHETARKYRNQNTRGVRCLLPTPNGVNCGSKHRCVGERSPRHLFCAQGWIRVVRKMLVYIGWPCRRVVGWFTSNSILIRSYGRVRFSLPAALSLIALP